MYVAPKGAPQDPLIRDAAREDSYGGHDLAGDQYVLLGA